MKKEIKKTNGFTIPELLAVIVILGILMTTAALSYNGISKRVKQNSLTQKINYLEQKAYEYASDNDVKSATVSVAHLIDLGYIAAEHPENASNERIDNPLTGEYLDCVTFTIEKDMDEYNVKTNMEGDCKVVMSEEREAKVTIEKYVKSGSGYTKIDDWTKEAVYVMVKVDSSLNLTKYPLVNNQITYNVNGSLNAKSGTYCSNISMNDTTNCNNVYEVNTGLLYNSAVTATLELIDKENNSTFKISKSTNVQIDKEKPNLRVDYNASYTSGSVAINLIGEDGSGSGIYGYYLNSNTLPSNATFNNFTRIDEANGKYNYETHVSNNGTYYAYTIDNVGNISDAQVIKITNIDKSGPQEFVNYNPNKGWTHDEALTISFGCDKDTNNNQTGCKDKVTYSVYDISNGYEQTIANNVTVNARSVSYTFKVDEGKNMKRARIKFDIWDNLDHKTSRTYDIPIMIDRVTPDIKIDIDKDRDSGWFGIVTYGYDYYFNVIINNRDKIASGIKTAGFWETSTSKSTFEADPYNPKWDNYFGNSSYWHTYVSKGSEIHFAARAVSGAGIPRYATATATGKGCTAYVASAATGAAIGAGAAFTFISGLVTGGLGWILGGGALIGGIFGAAACAAN